MKIRDRLLILFAVIVGIIAAKINIWGFHEFKKQIIVGILGVVFIDYLYTTIKTFRKYTLIQTKFDWIFRLSNLIIGVVAIGFLIPNWIHFFNFGWILLLFGFLGLISGIAYQNSIRIRKASTELIIKYKHRNEKKISNPDSLILENNKITIGEKDRFIEINDFKKTEKNNRLITDFFRIYYPEIKPEVK